MLNKLRSDNQESDDSTERKRSSSQRKYQKAPDIITQVKPNSFVQPINPHQSAFTPTNRSNKLNSEKLLLPPKSKEFSNKKTLILDLDETLVHSSFTPFEKNDVVLNVDFEGVMYNIYVLIRPDAELFIKSVGKFFELVIFTASISKYASPLLDILDKEKNIKFRLYRDQCTFINGIYIKDLKKCNRNLKDLIIVDNSPIAYTFDSDNGLPIKTWIEDPDDRELMRLLPILEFLSKTKDVRKFIDQFVYNNKILFNEAMEIIKIKEMAEKKNNLINNQKNNNINDNFTYNIKVLPKENFEDSSLKEDKKEKKVELKFNVNIDINDDNNMKKNEINPEIELRNGNDEFKLNLVNKDNNTSNNNTQKSNPIQEKGFNTTKNINKLSNNINFIDKDINIKESITNINNTNNDINMNRKKINSIKQNKKNTFRFRAQEQQQNKMGINNIIYSNKFDPSLPLTLLLSNLSKGLLCPKALSQEKTNKDKNKKKEKEKTNLNNIKPVLIKDLPNEKSVTNKKIKYINLLEKFKGNNKITNSLVNNVGIFNAKKMKNNYSMKNINVNKPYNLRVSSSISNYHGYAPNNNNKIFKEKNGTSYYKVTKSKSTENFLINTNKNKHPKTPKEQFRQKIVMNNKKIINFLDGINYTKSTKNKNLYSKESYGGIYKMKKNKNNKKK
jgi:Dullard-like phosphatase family protein